MTKYKKGNYGFVTDIPSKINGIKIMSYIKWTDMISRCYNKHNKDYKTYGARGITVCEEWKLFSNFAKWFGMNYISGFVLDKDLLSTGSKIYSPETCVFISNKENISISRIGLDYSHLSRRNDFNVYENKSIARSDFKAKCRREGVDFNRFKEIFSDWHVKPNGKRESKYNYILISGGENE